MVAGDPLAQEVVRGFRVDQVTAVVVVDPPVLVRLPGGSEGGDLVAVVVAGQLVRADAQDAGGAGAVKVAGHRLFLPCCEYSE